MNRHPGLLPRSAIEEGYLVYLETWGGWASLIRPIQTEIEGGSHLEGVNRLLDELKTALRVFGRCLLRRPRPRSSCWAPFSCKDAVSMH